MPRQSSRGLTAKSQILILIAAALALGIAASAFHVAWLPWDQASSRAAAQKTAEPGTFRPTKTQWAELGVAPVKSMRFTPTVFADGQIAADKDLTEPVFSPYSGRVLKVSAQLGEHVKQGAPLCAIDGTELVTGTDKLLAARATLHTARSQLKLAEMVAQRMHALYLAKGIALKDWQTSQTALIAAQDRLSAAQVAAATAKQQLSILGATRQQIARLERASPSQADPIAWVRAPRAGTVLSRQVNPDETIVSASASKPLFTIGDLSTLWLIAEVRESDAGRVRRGEPVTVSVLAYPGRIFTARLSWIAPSIDPKTHRLPVRADIANPDGVLKPGMFARFRIVTGPAVTAPAVPANAVVHSGTKERVWVVAPDNSLHVSEIRTGLIRRGMVEVLHGVRPGERVLTSGSLFIDHAAGGG